MFTSRRALRPVDPAADAVGAGEWTDDRLAEIADLVDREAGYGGRGRHPADPDGLADDLANDLDAYGDDLSPVQFDDRRPARGFDPWDDAALQDLAEELGDYEDFEPQRTAEGVLPPHSAVEEEAAPPRRLGVKLVAAAAVLLIGGGAAAYALLTGAGGIGAPSLVRAPTGPFKVVPEAGDTLEEPTGPNLVFNGTSLPAKGEERLVTRPDEVPELPGVTPQVNRVILPDGQEIAPEPVQPADTGPRRVRTVLVKPDGTIIESPDGPVPSLPSPAETSLLEPPVVTDPSALAPAEDAPSAAGLPPLPEVDQIEAPVAPVPAVSLPEDPLPTVAAEPSPVAAAPTPAEALLPPVPGEDPAAAAVAAPTTGPAPTPPNRPARPIEVASADPAATVAPVALPDPATTRAAAPARPAANANGPLDLAAAAAAPATAAPAVAAAAPASGAGSFVQVSSQRSESAAISAFQALQRKHPDILGGVAPDVQRADLGAKGVYYRARIPAASRDAAAALCSRLRAAGADCLIARN